MGLNFPRVFSLTASLIGKKNPKQGVNHVEPIFDWCCQ